MCGIAGIISTNSSEINTSLLKRMSDALIHRGPDGDGQWINPNQTVGLAHTRLAIIDLSSAGVQPMHYRERYSIVFNGEIYNYIELRVNLKKAGYEFVSNTDTEVILAAYDYYKEDCLHYFDGMFSFTIWDDVEQCLFAARDRFGEKPFYYFNDKGRFIFASEMKAIWSAGVEKKIEQRMLLNYIALGQVQNPTDKSQTFYSNIFSLPPSHYLAYHHNKIQIKKYWSLDKQSKTNITEKETIEKLDHLLTTSVAKRMRSDVPMGTSLSGGLDSSSLLYYIQKIDKKNYKTFSAVFPGFEKDEQEFIDKVSSQFEVDNYKIIPNELDLINDFEKLMYHQEEPFSTGSVYAQYQVFKLAKEHNTTVLLDGQGADEIFAGYHKYIHWFYQELINRMKFSKFLKEKKLFKQNDIKINWGIGNVLAAYFPSHASIALEKKVYNSVFKNKDISKELLASLHAKEWEGIHKPLITKLNDALYYNIAENGLEELLRFADRNAMAHGCEVRLPFLNHELVSFMFSLPSHFKINNGFTKSILRKLMNHRLSDDIVWRKEKVGFEPPQKKWLDAPMMKDYIHESKIKLVKEKILQPQTLIKTNQSLNAYEPDNYDWRYLCVAKMLHD